METWLAEAEGGRRRREAEAGTGVDPVFSSVIHWVPELKPGHRVPAKAGAAQPADGTSDTGPAAGMGGPSGSASSPGKRPENHTASRPR